MRSQSIRALAVGALLVGFGSGAQARTETLRWQHPAPAQVAGFRLLVGNATGSYQTTVDLGMPTASGGVFSYALQVPDSNTVYVTLTAYGSAGNESPRSNEQRRLGLLGTPGTPQVAP